MQRLGKFAKLAPAMLNAFVRFADTHLSRVDLRSEVKRNPMIGLGVDSPKNFPIPERFNVERFCAALLLYFSLDRVDE